MSRNTSQCAGWTLREFLATARKGAVGLACLLALAAPPLVSGWCAMEPISTLKPTNTEGSPVTWTGARPLNGTVGLPVSFQDGNFDDHLLDIQVPRELGPGRRVVVDIELTPGQGQAMALFIYPPGETDESGYEWYSYDVGTTPVRARLIDPGVGTWRIRVGAHARERGTAR